jgi:glycosyltransferase involved in cell wall biosynthesis
MGESRPHVLLVSHYFPPHQGGIENVVEGAATRLTEAGHDVTVLTTSPGGVPGRQRSPAGFTVVRVPTWNGIERRTGVPFPVIAPWATMTVARLVRDADVVHAHDVLYATTWLAALLARLVRRPLVLTQHVQLVAHPSRVVRSVQQIVYATAGRAVIATASRIVYLNDGVRDFLRRLGASSEQLVLLVNGIDTDVFHPADPAMRAALRTTFGLPTDKVLCLFVGRFVPKKGFATVLAAQHDSYTLVLAGGPVPPEQIDRGGVRFVGPQPPDRLADLYRACDVFVLPSVSEGFPLTVQEAMASGLPVVTTDDPGYGSYGLDRELVALVPPTVDGVRSTLVRLTGDEQLRLMMADYSRLTATGRFSWQRHVDGLTSIYASTVAAEEAARGAR